MSPLMGRDGSVDYKPATASAQRFSSLYQYVEVVASVAWLSISYIFCWFTCNLPIFFAAM